MGPAGPGGPLSPVLPINPGAPSFPGEPCKKYVTHKKIFLYFTHIDHSKVACLQGIKNKPLFTLNNSERA